MNVRNKYHNHLKELYSNQGLNIQQYVTTVYRPYYAPLEKIINCIKNEAKVLDIGTGTGLLLYLLKKEKNIKIGKGYDINSYSIEVAKNINKFEELNFYTGKMQNNLFEEVDTVTIIDLLHHLQIEKIDYLKNIIEKIRCGTRIVIKDLNPTPKWRAIANNITDYLSTKSKVSYVSLDSLHNLFKSSGLKIIHKEKMYKHVWSHYIIVVEK
tara:strand:+ start:1578 stop:2210 length:633 start_codon:yes stop_codon:yes gene_type:complete